MVDLHVHSTFSDGSCTPEQLAEMAATAGLTAIALTDHDCTDGNARFVAATAAAGVKGIPGVEISAQVDHGTMHMLGYFVEAGNPELRTALGHIRGGRDSRNIEILERLNGLGMTLTLEEVESYAAEDVVGRPHFAQALIARGYVADKDKAFDRWLGKGKPAYAERYRMTPEESLRVIRAAGGVPVLAHPFTLDLGNGALDKAVAAWKAQGLGGVEVYYSEHSAAQTDRYRELTTRHGLIATGGSDFHGATNPAVRLGVGFGGLCVPDSAVEGLERMRTENGR